MTILIITIVIIFGLTFVLANDAPWVPTKKSDINRFLKLVDIKKGQKMYDLGCGDGRLICAAANIGAEAEGVELSLFPFLIANIRRFFSNNREKITISYQNIWNTDLSDADVVYVWLMPKSTPKLKKKFNSELKKGAKIVTYVWPINGWHPVKIDEIKNCCKLYLYIKK